ncbi:MAG: hypothetical protein EOP56_13580 [Sphingobacteriales bacterium]|nr:MAG: hypothetical protein EOP56_13580 [Sphingobacteriales bacterium]
MISISSSGGTMAGGSAFSTGGRPVISTPVINSVPVNVTPNVSNNNTSNSIPLPEISVSMNDNNTILGNGARFVSAGVLGEAVSPITFTTASTQPAAVTSYKWLLIAAGFSFIAWMFFKKS